MKIVNNVCFHSYLLCIMVIFITDRNNNCLTWRQPQWPEINTIKTKINSQHTTVFQHKSTVFITLYNLPFSTKTFCQNSNHSLHWTQDSTMNDDWPLFLITFTTTRNNFKWKLGRKLNIIIKSMSNRHIGTWWDNIPHICQIKSFGQLKIKLNGSTLMGTPQCIQDLNINLSKKL